MNTVSLKIFIFPIFLPPLAQWFQCCLFLAYLFWPLLFVRVAFRFLVTSGCLLMFKSWEWWAAGVSKHRVGCWLWPSVWADLAGPFIEGSLRLVRAPRMYSPNSCLGMKVRLLVLGSGEGKWAETACIPCVQDHLCPGFLTVLLSLHVQVSSRLEILFDSLAPANKSPVFCQGEGREAIRGQRGFPVLLLKAVTESSIFEPLFPPPPLDIPGATDLRVFCGFCGVCLAGSWLCPLSSEHPASSQKEVLPSWLLPETRDCPLLLLFVWI